MSGSLRHVALTVEQIGDCRYGWLLIESAGGRVFVLKKAISAYNSYMGALDAGYQELALLSACGLHHRGPEQAHEEPQVQRSIELAELNDAV